MNYSLNFVWIEASRDSLPEKSQDAVCNVQEDLMANVQQIAEAYPDTDINIWVDVYGIGNNSPSIMRALNEKSSHSNIKFRSLDDVQGYAEHAIAKLPFDGFHTMGANIWEQIDFAKVNVVNHLLQNERAEAAIFSDMDMDLLGASFQKAVEVFQKRGVVVGLLEAKDGTLGLENQFFGFSKPRVDFVSEVLSKFPEEEIDETDQYTHFITNFDSDVTAPYGFVRDDIAVEMKQIQEWRKIKQSYQGTPPSISSL